MCWSLVIPLKPLAVAKSRLAPDVGAARSALVLAFAQDTVAAALSCPLVGDATIVTDDLEAASALGGMGAHVIPDIPRVGLNEALAYGACHIRKRSPHAPVAALGADLPALRPEELGRVLAAATAIPRRSFLADAVGVGTTLLAAPGDAALAPAFGGPSRARHRDSGALEIKLEDVESVRQDVDTLGDFTAARALGFGPHTAALFDQLWRGPRRRRPLGLTAMGER